MTLGPNKKMNTRSSSEFELGTGHDGLPQEFLTAHILECLGFNVESITKREN